MIGIVFPAYLKIPEERILNHFCWNEGVYASNDIRVYVVAEREYDWLPEYGEVVLFPIEDLPIVDNQPRFSIAKTKNRGNAKAIADGCDVILCTDVDIVFSPEEVAKYATMSDQEAYVPWYEMVESNLAKGRFDKGCTGTIAMTAENWRRISYDERCVGYGSDDGIMLKHIEMAGLKIKREGVVKHVAHVPGDSYREPGSGTATCWGREDGFNFDNFKNNRQYLPKARGGRRTRHIKR